MISRKTTKTLAELFEEEFRIYHSYRDRSGSGYHTIVNGNLYDFLFEHDYPAWFCNMAHKLSGYGSVKAWVMRLHTGETLTAATPDWTWEQREKLGQQYLKDIAEDILNQWDNEPDAYSRGKSLEKKKELLPLLELDGFLYREGKLLVPESDVLDVQEELGILEKLYQSLGLASQETAFHHLTLSEEHYRAEKWDDSISNSRKFLECVLREVATAHSLRKTGQAMPPSSYDKPVLVRDYLERENLLEKKEKEAIASIYGLLSNTGSHPYMAQKDQARLLRQLSLTVSQFVLLRFGGEVKGKS